MTAPSGIDGDAEPGALWAAAADDGLGLPAAGTPFAPPGPVARSFPSLAAARPPRPLTAEDTDQVTAAATLASVRTR